MAPTGVKSGVIIAGVNPMAADLVATAYMGLDYKKVKSLNIKEKTEKRLMDFTVDDIEIMGMNDEHMKGVDHLQDVYKYKLPSGWKGYL